jgi:hypothetical protein
MFQNSYMKNIFLVLLIAFSQIIFAQVPSGFSYQAVVRSAGGQILPNQHVSIRFKVRVGSATGTTEYIETQSVNTNQFGLLNAVVGNGTAVQGSLNNVSWSTGRVFLETEIDVAGGSNYVSMGASKLQSVPYALYAANASASAGAKGDTGPKGDAGATGAKGDTGAQGVAGPKGDTGAAGIQGIQGPKGDTGAAGTQGAKGDTGAQGLQGLQGITGEKGATGSSKAEATFLFNRAALAYVGVATVAPANGLVNIIPYKGSSYYGSVPTEIELVISANNANALNYTIKLVDAANGNIVASATGNALTGTALQKIILTVDPSLFPANSSNLSLQANVNSKASGRLLRIYSMYMKYN